MLASKNLMLLDETIQKLLKDAIGVQKGELVLLQFWGEDADRELLHKFSNQVAALGASPMEYQEVTIVDYLKMRQKDVFQIIILNVLML